MNIKETTPGSADQSDTRKPATDEDLLAWSESDHITQDMIESMDARIDQDRGRIRSLEDKLAENERVRIRLVSLLPLDLRDKKEAFVSDGRAETRPSLCVCGHSVLDHAPICKSCGHEKVIPSKCDFFTSSSGLSDEQIQRARVQLKPEACAEGHLLNGGAKVGCKACGKALGEKLHRTLRDDNLVLRHENEAFARELEELEGTIGKCDEIVCSATCPSVWKSTLPQPHSDLCAAVSATAKRINAAKVGPERDPPLNLDLTLRDEMLLLADENMDLRSQVATLQAVLDKATKLGQGIPIHLERGAVETLESRFKNSGPRSEEEERAMCPECGGITEDPLDGPCAKCWSKV